MSPWPRRRRRLTVAVGSWVAALVGALVPRCDGAWCHRLWAGIGVKAKALVRLQTGDGDALAYLVEGITLSPYALLFGELSR